MVFENQLDLIAENAILSSQHKGTNLKYRIDNVIGTDNKMTTDIVNKILKDATSLGIGNLTLFSESGKVFVSVLKNKIVEKQTAEINELKMINMAITRQGFEDKLFFHSVDKKHRIISLYIPFTYEGDKIGVAAIELEMKDIERHMTYLYGQCILIGLFVVVFHIGFAVLLFKMILIPLRKLNEATHKIAQGQLDIRVSIVGENEIGQLASSFNEMGVALQRMQNEAKGANPLTGLPGNISIANYIDKCLNSGKCICVLYCDLDNFKAYNDKYGFTRGDDAILYTRDCLNAVAKRKDVKDAFVGHEGGDDFVVITEYEYWETFAKSFITTFDRGIYQFYNSIDSRNGFIESVNRQGERQRFPLMSVSVAVVTNKNRPFHRHAEMIAVAAEIKKYVKSMDGSCYAIDRRAGPSSPAQRINSSDIPTQPHP